MGTRPREEKIVDGKRGSIKNVGGVAMLQLATFLMAVVFPMYNKYLFSGPLDTPMLATAAHRVSSFLGAVFIWMLSPASFYTRTKITRTSMWLKIMLIPLGFVINIGMSNLSLSFTTLALNQLVRSLSPVVIAVTSFLVENKMQSNGKFFTLCFLMIGVLLGVSASDDFDPLGITVCMISVIGQSISVVMTAYVMTSLVREDGSRIKLGIIDVLLYASLPTLALLLPGAYFRGEFEVCRESIRTLGFLRVAGYLSIGGVMAFIYSLCWMSLVRQTSSTFLGITTGCSCAFSIALSFHFFPQHAGLLSVAGIVMTIAAYFVNSVLTLREKYLEAANDQNDMEVDEEEVEELLGKKQRGAPVLIEADSLQKLVQSMLSSHESTKKAKPVS
uniref:Sugar phosphate transporter domain-containing protein n=1 Tax=Lotharella globosa TaxID=91324 RepID=A0A7S3Z9D2_9EUKA|mmetsp:Transcript_30096/g.58025  ORF Transcript_30096/g.58025 Transcript_30096/m.58025 type:complete len:388 (+) Transcript_30096:102-1265(+)